VQQERKKLVFPGHVGSKLIKGQTSRARYTPLNQVAKSRAIACNAFMAFWWYVFAVDAIVSSFTETHQRTFLTSRPRPRSLHPKTIAPTYTASCSRTTYKVHSYSRPPRLGDFAGESMSGIYSCAEAEDSRVMHYSKASEKASVRRARNHHGSPL
jgi:hypothetical protein